MKNVKSSKGGKKKVLHVTDFRELFELPDDLRKDRPGPLTYTKSFVTLTAGSKEHDIKHFERLEELKSRPERHLLRSVFEDIKNFSGKKTIRHRGFLLTTSEQPATYEYLAGQLKVAVEELKKAMPVLEEIGLLESVTMDMLPSDGRFTKTTKKQRKAAGTKRSKSKAKKTSGREKKKIKSGGKKSTPDASGCVQMKPDASGTKRKPLYNKTKPNGKKRSNRTKNKTNGNDESQGLKKSVDKRCEGNSNKLKGKPKQQSTAATSTKPQLSAGSGGRVIGFPVPPPAANHNRNQPQRLGDIIEGMKHRWDDDAKQFGCDIYRALKLPWDPASSQGKRELTCFASVWMKAKRSGISPPVLGELHRRAIQEAEKISNRKSRCGNVSAVFCHVFARLVAARCVAARTELGGCG